MKGPTGIPSLDTLLRPVQEGWIVEAYGDGEPVSLVMHHSLASLSRGGTVALVNVQDFGGVNPYLVRRLSKLYGGSPERVLLVRAFRLRDVPAAVEAALAEGPAALVVNNPYLYAPRSPSKYSLLTPVTAALRRAAQRVRVVLVFNRPTRLGPRGMAPEGGNFHHHSVHVIVRLRRARRGVYAELVKHPHSRVPRHTFIPWPELAVGERLWGGQRPLLEYL